MDDSTVQQPVVDTTNDTPNEDTLTVEQPQEVQQPESTETQQEAGEEVQEQVEVPEVPEQSYQQPEVVEEDEDEDYIPFTPTVPEQGYEQLPQFDFSQVQTDENGNVDPNSLAQAINQQIQQAVQNATKSAASMVKESEERRVEEAQWQRAREKAPELKTDKQLAQEVQALRYGMFMSDISAGKENAKMLTPLQAYERLNKRISSAKSEGAVQATQSVRVQESAYVEPTSNASSAAGSDKDALYQKMRSPDRSEADKASHDLLKSMLFGE